MSVNTKVNGQLVPSAGLYSVTKPIGMADIYSTEEKEVGLWIDNKPLYQKTFRLSNVTLSSGSNTVVSTSQLSSLSIDKVIGDVSGSLTFNSGANAIDIPYAIGATSYITAYYDNSTGIVVLRGGSALTTTDIYLTIQYTKTTDTPWSGKFVPQGYGYVSSGDIYSLEERQVGVFADGKPLYQKTIAIEGTKTIGTTWTDIAEIPNVDKMDSAEMTTGAVFSDTRIRYQYTNGKLQAVATSSLSLANPLFTVRYTKTTDVAGSGEYVPSGDKAKHYTADEHIVGTWIDGSTLYERTITGTTNPNTDTLIIECGEGNVIRNFYGIIGGVRLINSYIDNLSYATTWIAGNQHQLGNVCNSSIYQNKSFYVTLEYTKTTS